MRFSHSQASRKLLVILLYNAFLYFRSSFFTTYYPIASCTQAQNLSLQHNEREAWKRVQENNLMMKKVIS
jgi:hypothetical protein